MVIWDNFSKDVCRVGAYSALSSLESDKIFWGMHQIDIHGKLKRKVGVNIKNYTEKSEKISCNLKKILYNSI